MSDNLVAVGAAAAPLDDEDTIMDDPDNDEEEEGDFQYYYNAEFDTDAQDALSESKKDPEYFEFECLHVADVDRLLNESVEAICSRIPVTPSIAKVCCRLSLRFRPLDIDLSSLPSLGSPSQQQMEH